LSEADRGLRQKAAKSRQGTEPQHPRAKKSCLVDIFLHIRIFICFAGLYIWCCPQYQQPKIGQPFEGWTPKSNARFTLEMTGVSLFLESELLLKYAGTRCLSP
jgi:hypothetical protein